MGCGGERPGGKALTEPETKQADLAWANARRAVEVWARLQAETRKASKEWDTAAKKAHLEPSFENAQASDEAASKHNKVQVEADAAWEEAKKAWDDAVDVLEESACPESTSAAEKEKTLDGARDEKAHDLADARADARDARAMADNAAAAMESVAEVVEETAGAEEFAADAADAGRGKAAYEKAAAEAARVWIFARAARAWAGATRARAQAADARVRMLEEGRTGDGWRIAEGEEKL